MDIRHLRVEGAFEVTPATHTDDRGVFLEWFRQDRFRGAAGHALTVAQANCSVSAAGVLRGVHFAAVPPGQAKYVTCVRGAVHDVVVDLRTGSPTFGRWDSTTLDDRSRRGVYLGEGLGHAFMALTEQATVVYLCSTPYDPAREHAVHPMDPDLAITWPVEGPDGRPLTPRLSHKDAVAPTLQQSRDAGVLPEASVVARHLDALRTHGS